MSENKLPQRKPTRLKYFNYNANGAYFLTICTKDKRHILSRITDTPTIRGDTPNRSVHSPSALVGGDAQLRSDLQSAPTAHVVLDAPNRSVHSPSALVGGDAQLRSDLQSAPTAHVVLDAPNRSVHSPSALVGGDVLDAPNRSVHSPSSLVGGDVLDAPNHGMHSPSSLVGGDVLDAPNHVTLLPHGEIAKKYIEQLSSFYPNLEVGAYVIMPNHIHLLLFVFEDIPNGASRTSPPTPARQHSTVSRFVSTLKRFCNKEYGENIWQRHFYDHIIRNREDYEQHIKYIEENPLRWLTDELY